MNRERVTAILDRLEGDDSVIELSGKEYRLPREWLPREAREGDVLRVEASHAAKGASVAFTIDRQATQRARAEALALVNKLRR